MRTLTGYASFGKRGAPFSLAREGADAQAGRFPGVGLVVEDIVHLGTGVRDVTGLGYALAELHSAGELYVLRAVIDDDYIIVSADIPRRFERQRR